MSDLVTKGELTTSENINIVATNAPQVYGLNLQSHDKCVAAGQELLNLASSGMSDELDQQIERFIAKAKATYKAMYERRSSVTKIFDEIRSAYTILEKDIDAQNSTSVTFQLQNVRNSYARKKREEEEKKRFIESAKNMYRQNCIEDYKMQFNKLLTTNLNRLQAVFSAVTLENYNDSKNAIQAFDANIFDSFNIVSQVPLPSILDRSCTDSIRTEVYNDLMPKFREQYSFEITSTRDEYLEMLPSKKRQLEEAAKASAEEAEIIRQQMALREAQEAQEKEKERQLAQQREQTAKTISSVENLFAAASAATPAYQPKTSVKLKMQILDKSAFLEIVSLWWTEEGCKMDFSDLEKAFKKQITFCNKLANKANPIKIQSNSIRYIEEVKAK